MEVWEDIKGYEGKYQVSNMGNVRSTNYNNTGKPKELKQKINKYGFCEVKLSKNNKTKDFMVARLVAEAFIPNNANKPIVMHKSKDGTDNRVENLKWVYSSEPKFNMYKKGSRKKGRPSINTISYKGKGYKSFTEMAEDYGLSPHQLLRRLNRAWTLEEALEIPLNKCGGGRPLFYDYYGEYMTLEQLSKISGLPKKLIQKRLCRGWNIYESVEIPKGIFNKKEF